jgi:hypothetical protein
MTTTVWCTTQIIGFHSWPTAPAAVAFLRDKHRHVFHIRAEVQEDSERGVEFTLLKQRVEAIISDRYSWMPTGYDFGTRSCECIAKDIMEGLANACFYVTAVEVSEDGENGARVCLIP